jgi:hypothetical protein
MNPGRTFIRDAPPARIIQSGEGSVARPSGSQDSDAERETAELRKTTSPVEVVLTRSVQRVIGDELFALTRTDGKECGGFLYARPSFSWHRQVEILVATTTGDADRSSHYVKLDSDEWLRNEWAIEEQRNDLALAGLWHSHPATHSRDGGLSRTDLGALTSVLDWNVSRNRDTAYSVGLLYCADPRYESESWATPGLHAFVVRREGYSRRPVCERANVRKR